MRQVAIPREVYTGSCNQLFDFLAEALVHFIKEQNKVGCGMVMPWVISLLQDSHTILLCCLGDCLCWCVSTGMMCPVSRVSRLYASSVAPCGGCGVLPH